MTKTDHDWSPIEADYRAGIKSLRQIASQNGVSEGAIRKRAKREDWERDLAAKIQAKADALVRRDAVRVLVRTNQRVPEKVVIAANANASYRVQMTLRDDIQRTFDLFSGLLTEVESSSIGAGLIGQLHEILSDSNGDDDSDASRKRAQRQRELMDKVLSIPGRIDSGKKLVDMLEKLVKLKREAFGIKSDDGGGPPPATVLTDAERASRLAALVSKARAKKVAADA